MTQQRPEADISSFDFVSSDTDQPVGRRFKAAPADQLEKRGRHYKSDAQDFGPGYQPRHGGSDQKVIPSVAPTAAAATPPRARAPKVKISPVAASQKVTVPVKPVAKTPVAKAPPSAKAPAAKVPAIPRDVRWAVLPSTTPRRAVINSRRHLPAPLTLRDFLPVQEEASSVFDGIERELPSLKKALSQKGLSAAASDAWWKELVGDAFSDRQLAWHMSPRLLAAASIAAIVAIGATHFPGSTTPDTQVASASSVSSAPDREVAMQAASRSFIRASVATPATPPPTTTPPTTAPPVKVAPPTTAAPKRAAVAPASTSNCSSSKAAAHACWDGLINQYDWNDTTAFNVMWCESTGNPNARNRHSTATGLFQILGGPTDPVANVRQAHDMWKSRGWQPWVCKG